MTSLLSSRPSARFSAPTQIKTYTAATITECLLHARRELGPDAEIIGQRKFKKGAWFGRWGGKELIEVTCRLTEELPPAPRGTRAPSPSHLRTLETRLTELANSVQGLVEAQKPAFRPSPVAVVSGEEKKQKSEGGGQAAKIVREPYPALLQQLLDADVAPPVARQLIAEMPSGLGGIDAQTELRTVIAQRLRIATPSHALLTPGRPRMLAFVGTTGVGKTTTIAKLAARFSLVDGKSVGIVTLDTYRVGAADQLQKIGEVLKIPVRVAHDEAEFRRQVAAFAAEGRDWVFVDTAGRSPNDMLPLGETAQFFQGIGPIVKLLTLPATLSARDMENIIVRFQNLLQPDALILTKLDEATDNSCFGKLLTAQAKHGLPLAYLTTGQKIPDDLALPNVHAIAAKIVTTSVL